MKQSLMFQVSERVIRSLTGKHSKVRQSVLCEIKKKKKKVHALPCNHFPPSYREDKMATNV